MKRGSFFLLSLLLATLVALNSARAATFIVTTTADSDAGSLRQAITDANGAMGLDTINFAIPDSDAGRDATTGIFTITSASALPIITSPLTIDGFTQTGSRANTLAVGSDAVRLITISGSSLFFQFGSDGSTVRGLTIRNFNGGGILFSSSADNRVTGCDIRGGGNGNSGVLIFSGDNTIIGGTLPSERNVIDNVETRANNTRVQNNYIGTNAQGTARGSSFQTGIVISGGSNNLIGGPDASAGNVISGNGTSSGGGRDGISIFLSGVSNPPPISGNLIQNNIIGLDVTGTQAVGNVGNGISISAFSTTGISGTRILDNVIAGNGNSNSSPPANGIYLRGRGVTGTLVSGNTIGLNRARSNFVPNSGSGILLDGAANSPATGNVFTQNFIAGNTALGIDLGGDGFGTGNGVTPNDAGDADAGPNNEQNFPVLSAVNDTDSSIVIEGTLNSVASTDFRIEFFANAAADASGNGEGQTFLGFQNVSTDANGNAIINATLPVALPPSQRFVTATATRLNGADLVETSEFSAAQQSSGDSCSFEVINTNDSGEGSLRAAIECANASNLTQTITFNIPGPPENVKTIALASPLPTITVPLAINGFSQPGSNPYTTVREERPGEIVPPVNTAAALRVELNGANAGAGANGLVFGAGSNGSVVRGLVINRFAGNGIVLRSNNNEIAGCFIGTSADGTTARGNAGDGVLVDGGSSMTLGNAESTVDGDPSGINTTTTRRYFNLISANGAANVHLVGSNNLLVDNFIGTDVQLVSSTKALGGGKGVVIDGSDNRVTATNDNSIAGHSGPGVEIVRGNNNTFAIAIGVGSVASVQFALGNGSHGVIVGSGGAANNNSIGATIANNNGDGVRVVAGTGNGISALFSNNAGLGINLVGGNENASGVTANDAGDGDSGPNTLQNFPIITSATPSSDDDEIFNSTPGTIIGTLNSLPNTTFRLRFYSSTTADPSGNGEGESAIIIGDPLVPVSTDVTTDAQGNANFNFPAFQLFAGRFVTATATNASNTSEFSNAVMAGTAPNNGTVQFNATTYSASENDGNATITITRSGSTTGAASVRVATADGTAVAGTDYTAVNQVLSFAAGETTKTVTVPIVKDALDEPNETVNLTLSNPTGATLGTPSSAVLTIVNATTPANTAPVAASQNVSTRKNTPLTLVLAATDADNDTLTFRIVAQPKNGTLSGSAANLTYTPNADFVGTDSFTFVANDGKADSNVATIALQVLADTPANTPPVAANQTLQTRKDTPLTLALTATDANSDALTFRIVSQPKNGKLSGNAANLTYTPNVDFTGSDSFTFVANDGQADSNIATVTLQVLADTPVNQAPVTQSQNLRTDKATPLLFALTATDANNDTLTFRIVSQPKNGKLSGNAARLTYTPNADFTGTDSFTFVANDGTVDSNIATITLQVLAAPVENTPPVAQSAQLRTDKATPLLYTLRASDADNDPLTFRIVSQPKNGKLSGNAQNLTYTPNDDFTGTDTFTFVANDGKADSNLATITVQVLAGGNPPPPTPTPVQRVQAINDSYNLTLGRDGQAQNAGVALLNDGTFRIAPRGVLANDRALPGKNLSARLTRGPQNGRVQLNADGSFDYQPSAGFAGTDEFTYMLSDGQNTDTARVRLIVIDRRGPELRFDTPTDGAIGRVVSEIRGRVRDLQSGVKSVSVLWRREADGAFWNGSAWIDKATPLIAQAVGTNWEYEGDLPDPGDNPDTDLLDGEYAMQATALDNAGNSSRVLIRFTVDNAAPQTPELSEVRLSSAGASAEQGAIALRFTGALDATSASDTMNYAIAINGVETEIGAADYASNVVTLSGFDLQEGDEIELRVEGLRDTEGKSLQDGVINLVAR